MRNPIEIFLIIIMCAIITFGLRALPFAVFCGKRKMPVWLETQDACVVRAVRKSTAAANYGSSDCILPKRYND